MTRAWGFSKYLKHTSTRDAPVLLTSTALPPPDSARERASATAGPESTVRYDVYFRAAPGATRPEIIYQLDRRERLVFLLLDGRRSLGDIARLVHRDEQEIACTVARLLRSGYVEHIEEVTTEPAR